jgi:hypothetical protein
LTDAAGGALGARDLFPALAGFPDAVADVGAVDSDATSLRLLSKIENVARLPQLSRLERLWCFDLNVRSAAIVGRVASLRRLYLDRNRLPDFDAFTTLTRLEVLSIEGGTRISSLNTFTRFDGVHGLGLIHFPQVRSLAPLSDFRSLLALAVAGGMWTRMNVASLAPLGSLRQLQFLHLTNLKADDGSLEPLADLTALESLDLPNFYSLEEFARLSARLKGTRCTWFAPHVAMRSSSCRKCGQTTMLILTGKGMPMLCSSCDAVRVHKHEQRFQNAASATASGV